jgi:hypothetical protein
VRLKHVPKQAPDRLFVVDDQHSLEIEQCLSGGAIEEQRHGSMISRVNEVRRFVGLDPIVSLRTLERGAPFVPLISDFAPT